MRANWDLRAGGEVVDALRSFVGSYMAINLL